MRLIRINLALPVFLSIFLTTAQLFAADSGITNQCEAALITKNAHELAPPKPSEKSEPRLQSIASHQHHQSDASIWNDDPLLVDLANHIIPEIEQAAIEELDTVRNSDHFDSSGKSKYVKFYEAIDQLFRQDPRIPQELLNLSARRLPFLRNGPFVLFLSGGVAKVWTEPILQHAKELGLDPIIVWLPGGISVNRVAGRLEIPEFPQDLKDLIAKRPAIFMDDTYSTGGTSEAVRAAVRQDGGRLDGVFVGYANSRGNPSSIYTSGRLQGKPTGEDNFPSKPMRWRWVQDKPVRLGIRLQGTLLKADSWRWTPQGLQLLNVLNQIGAEVKLLGDDKDIAKASIASRTTFSNIKWLDSTDTVDVKFGNFGRLYYGNQHPSPITEENQIETIAIGRDQIRGTKLPVDLETNYLVNVLVEHGILSPIFSNPPSADASPSSIQKIFDLTGI